MAAGRVVINSLQCWCRSRSLDFDFVVRVHFDYVMWRLKQCMLQLPSLSNYARGLRSGNQAAVAEGFARGWRRN